MKYCLFTLLAGGLLLFSSCNNKGENYDRIIRNEYHNVLKEK